MFQSIYTEYHDDQMHSPSRVSNHHKKLSPVRSSNQLYIERLEIKVKQLKNQIHKNKPLLEKMKTQRKFFKKISDKQRIKIEQTNITEMRQSYEMEINRLQKQKIHLQQVISLLHEESNKKISDFIQAKQQIMKNRDQMTNMLEQVKKQNSKYQEIIKFKDIAIEDTEQSLELLKKEVSIKERVRAKYQQALCAIQEMQQKKCEQQQKL